MPGSPDADAALAVKLVALEKRISELEGISIKVT